MIYRRSMVFPDQLPIVTPCQFLDEFLYLFLGIVLSNQHLIDLSCTDYSPRNIGRQITYRAINEISVFAILNRIQGMNPVNDVGVFYREIQVI
jgi:hypothetical protein